MMGGGVGGGTTLLALLMFVGNVQSVVMLVKSSLLTTV